MAASSSTYGPYARHRKAPMVTVTQARFGLCPTHRTAILSDGECWDCGSAPLAAPAPVVRTAERMATPGQFDLLKAMFAERAGNETADTLRTVLLGEYRAGRMTFALAKSGIESLKRIPRTDRPAPSQTPALPEIPDGRYAIASTGTNDLVFYRVTSGEKWGKSVQMIVGGHLDTFVARKTVPGILARIASDTYERPEQHDSDENGPYTIPAGSFSGPEGAALRFGDEIKRCSRCNRTLTDRQSRLDGIGPVCITKGE